MTMSNTALLSEPYIFDPRPHYPFQITAKRYWSPAHSSVAEDALTLICAHSAGAHKEQWEPTLQHLLARFPRDGPVKIREVWSLDAPNHGDAAVLNEDVLHPVLDWRPEAFFGWEEYARSVHAFLAGLGTGVPVDFRGRRLVAIGHSIGAVAMMLSTTYLPRVTFSSLILVEPMIMRKPEVGEQDVVSADVIWNRKDVWSSREAAMQYFMSRPMWQRWDPCVLQIFLEHGLRKLPTAAYPNETTGVTLKCPKAQETAIYRERQSILRGYHYLHVLCTQMPVHIIYGAIPDFIAANFQEEVLRVASQGRHATEHKVQGAGHMVVQAQPEGLADAIGTALVHDASAKFPGDDDLRARL